jgi:hypothetical protein
MESKRILIRFIFLSFMLLIMSLLACKGIEIMIQQDRYTPAFSAPEYSKYKGKSIYLSSFENRANDTFLWGYQSLDRKITYKSQVSVLESYFGDCFQKAFHSIGMGVYKDAGPAGVPEFHFILTSLNDQEFNFTVTLLKNGFLLFEKKYTVTMPSAQTVNISELEKRAYELIDLSFTTILNDPEFYQKLL